MFIDLLDRNRMLITLDNSDIGLLSEDRSTLLISCMVTLAAKKSGIYIAHKKLKIEYLSGGCRDFVIVTISPQLSLCSGKQQTIAVYFDNAESLFKCAACIKRHTNARSSDLYKTADLHYIMTVTACHEELLKAAAICSEYGRIKRISPYSQKRYGEYFEELISNSAVDVLAQ